MSYHGISEDDSLNTIFTHVSDPTKDLSMEANMVLRNIYAALNEDLPL